MINGTIKLESEYNKFQLINQCLALLLRTFG